ncbi:MAG: VWA domain-containing protein [Prochloraceae cyanobacterium]|nr:VWA domain-containing protein [Prochloraceae cyanobacterium]
MKICPQCGASNSDAAKFCLECGRDFKLVESNRKSQSLPQPNQDDLVVDLSPSTDSSISKPAYTTEFEPTGEVSRRHHSEIRSEPQPINADSILGLSTNLISKLQRSGDIMFVLDCTESMKGEIEAIKDTIIDFADSIKAEGINLRVGLIEFRDRLINEEHRVLRFNGEIFTKDPIAFRQEVSQLTAIGGGDWPESSLDAIMLAIHQPFAPEAQKVIVLVTDAPPHLPDRETQSITQVLKAIAQNRIDQIHMVMNTQDPESQIYLKMLEVSRGLAFDIGQGHDFSRRSQHFKQTLMKLGKTLSQTL